MLSLVVCILSLLRLSSLQGVVRFYIPCYSAPLIQTPEVAPIIIHDIAGMRLPEDSGLASTPPLSIAPVVESPVLKPFSPLQSPHPSPEHARVPCLDVPVQRSPVLCGLWANDKHTRIVEALRDCCTPAMDVIAAQVTVRPYGGLLLVCGLCCFQFVCLPSRDDYISRMFSSSTVSGTSFSGLIN